MTKSALLLPGAGRSGQDRQAVLEAGSFHPGGCFTQPVNEMN